MGKELVQNFPIARELFEEASEAIKFDLKKLCFDGPESDLTKTENTQPALVVTSVAAFRVAEKEAGFKPLLVAGHSLGEYSALVTTQAIEFSTAVKWVRSRGQAMQSAVPQGEGSMAAIMGGDDNLVTKLCEAATLKARALDPTAVVEPANFNAPGQVVIAGTTAAIQAAIDLVKAGGAFAGLKAIPLQVSAPFHCSLMKPAREYMSQVFL